jgi:hypothetical protein
MSETTISERFEVVYDEGRYVPSSSPLLAGEWVSPHWGLEYDVLGQSWQMALLFPTRRQAEIALEACKRLGVTPASYRAAAESPEGSGELRRRIMEMFPW